jgi:hypothetical protein
MTMSLFHLCTRYPMQLHVTLLHHLLSAVASLRPSRNDCQCTDEDRPLNDHSGCRRAATILRILSGRGGLVTEIYTVDYARGTDVITGCNVKSSTAFPLCDRCQKSSVCRRDSRSSSLLARERVE